MKDVIFDLLDDILQGNIDKDTLTKNNRLYYTGIFILLIVMLLHFLELIVHTDNNNNNNNNNNQRNIIELRLVKD